MFLKFTRTDLLVILTLACATFLCGFLTSMVIPIFPYLINHPLGDRYSNLTTDNSTSLNYKKLSILFVTKNVFQIFFCPVIGHFIDVFGSLIILLGGTIFQIVTISIYGLGKVYYLLLLGRVFEAISVSSVTCSVSAFVAFRFKDQRQRGFVYGVNGLCLCVGSALGPGYGGVVYQYYGETVAFLSIISFSTVELIFIGVLIFFERRGKKHCDVICKTEQDNATITVTNYEEKSLMSTAKKEQGDPHHQNIMFFKDPYFLISVGTFPVIFVSIYLLFSSLPQYMAVKFNASVSEQGTIWMVNLLGYVLGFLSSNIINTRLSKYRHIVLVLYTFLHALGILSIAFMPNWWSLAIPLCTVVHVHLVAEAVVAPILATIVETRHSSKFGVMSGIIMTTIGITAAVGSFGGPVLLNTIGFAYMNGAVCAVNVLYAPFYLFLGKFCRDK